MDLMKCVPFLIVLALTSCNAKQQTQTTNAPREIAIKKLGAKIDSFPNASGKYILYVQQRDAQLSPKLIRAVVVEATTGKIMLEDSFMPGYIKWTGETTLEVFSVPGMIKKDEDSSSFKRKITIPAKYDY